MKDNRFSIMILIGLVLYIISPIDFVPGPVDDAILTLMYVLSQGKAIVHQNK